jgi:hypothetical protein
VDVFYLLATGSIEEIIWRLVQKKQRRAVRLMQDRVGSFSADRTHHIDGAASNAEVADHIPDDAKPGDDGEEGAAELLNLIGELSLAAAPAPVADSDETSIEDPAGPSVN